MTGLEDLGSSAQEADTHRATETPVVSGPDSGAWFYSRDEYIWSGSFTTRDEAICEGRNDYGPEADFKVAFGGFTEPWQDLFDHKDALLDFIDTAHEDRTFEDTFTTEADLPSEAWEDLRAKLNGVWSDWVGQHKPTSRALELGGAEAVPAIAKATGEAS